MLTTDERVDRLETIVIELAEAQMRTQVSLKTLSDEMTAFKGKVDQSLARTDRAIEELRADRKQRDTQWGHLTRRLGTMVEDIVAPNIPRIARERFGWSEILFFSARVEAMNRRDKAIREFDIIAVESKQIIVNKTKSKPTTEYVNDLIAVLGEIWDYFPEHKGKTVTPIFSSLGLPENLVKYLTRHRIYAMAMGDGTMSLLNFHQVNERR
jgi:hypothetical protein